MAGGYEKTVKARDEVIEDAEELIGRKLLGAELALVKFCLNSMAIKMNNNVLEFLRVVDKED